MAARVVSVAAIAIALLGAAGCDVPWRHEMQQQRSLASTHSPRALASGVMTTEAESRAERAAPAGRALYEIYCTPCHGPGGIGNGPVRDHFALGVDARPADLTSDAVQQHSDEWLFATITNGTQRMPAYHYELSTGERWRIVAYVRQFKAVTR